MNTSDNNNSQPKNFTDTDIPTLGWNNDSIKKWCKVIGVTEDDIKIIGAKGLDGYWFNSKRNNLEALLDRYGVSPSSSIRIHDKFNPQPTTTSKVQVQGEQIDDMLQYGNGFQFQTLRIVT
ncbi:hypothetical protein DLAC_08578 [Tieghemostelium lacteum]|uniref:SAM domain-containing protein n=1 Tax=Tieghemostelium lacteum TaxID=361077 RepID=A0A151Z887_TIELA|nr:hypothetical protein DLAC_08578 [Tieghemostelium lacteum]|eukprot:KYQ90004.1 hypothetical protein DLAC_08578 [Tieghemostelium lacteum]